MRSLNSTPDTRLKCAAALINQLLVWVPGASLDEINALVDSKTLHARGTETWFGRHVDTVEPR